MIIAIDGPAGCGKSTIARKLAKELGFYYLNTGSFYRAYTLSEMDRGGDVTNPDSVLENAKRTEITVKNGNICINGVDSEARLHSPEVDKYCSPVSKDQRLRELVNEKVRGLAKGMNIITEGRDTTTVIFPDAEYKFYFDASAEERAKRRHSQQKDQNIETILAGIIERDKTDKEKKFGALKIAPNATYIDTSNLTIEQVCERVKSAMLEQK